MILDDSKKEKTKSFLSEVVDTDNWRYLLKNIPNVRHDVFLMIFSSVIINILALALPIALMQIYDRIIPNSSYSTLSWLITGVTVAIVLETILKTARSYLGNWLSARLDHILNSESLRYFLSARLDLYEKDKAGVHFERFNAVNTIKQYISGQILTVFLDIPFALLFLGLLYYIGGGLVFYTLLILTVFVTLSFFSKKRFEYYNERQIDLNKENLDFILETLGGIHTIKSMSMEERMFRKFENIQARSSDTGNRSRRWRSFPTISTSFFSQFNMLGIIFLGADLVIKGDMTIGAMTACTMLATRGLQPVAKLIGFWISFSEVKTAQKQIREIISLTAGDEIKHDFSLISGIEGSVSFENFSFYHENLNLAIEDFNALIGAGEVVGVTGDNPELTSALMLSVCGMYKPSKGEVFIDEYKLSTMDHSSFGGRVEYLPRKGRLFAGSILDNISMLDPKKRRTALDTAALLELDQFVSDLPNGYETLVDQRANESMPLGLIQRTSFARVLVTCPRILILDRTLNSLDIETHRLVSEILNSLKGRCTIFIVSDYSDFPVEPDKFIECSSAGINFYSNEKGSV